MQRRGEIGVKGQRTTRPKVRKASTAQRSTDHSTGQFDRLKRERDEAREQLAATADILRVIRASPTVAQPVFETIVRNAVSLCGGLFANVFSFDGELLHYVASHNVGPSYADMIRVNYPMRPDSSQVSGRVVLAKSVVWLEDALADPDYDQRYPRAMGWRRLLGVPMLHEGNPIGAITVGWAEPGPPTKAQEELLKTFADQAVIAIENVRLFEAEQKRRRELSESLEQQTATSEVLKVISSSPSDLKPVFQSMLENSVRICEAKFGQMFLCEGDKVRAVAQLDVPTTLVEWDEKHGAFQPSAEGGLMRAIRTKKVIHIDDLMSEQPSLPVVKLGGARSYIAVPMLKESELVGVIVIYRQEVRPFTEKQIDLVQNFAAQAVIAIENSRLLNELRESLQQQTATADVLKVISRSTFDLPSVLQTLVESAARLCDADKSIITREKNGVFYRAEAYGFSREFMDHVRDTPIKAERGSGIGRALLESRVIHIPDVRADPDYTFVEHQRLGDFRTLLGVPMLRDGVPIGVVTLTRTEIRPFSDKQIELATTFADQAAIAIENVRLLNNLNKLNQQLEQRVADQVSEIERMGKLRRFLPPQVADLIVASGTEKQLESHRREITALFCDLRGFTGFSESSDPEDVMALLRDYHAAIGGIINKYGGTLERYAGDGVMVVFNDPIPVDNPALQAVLMAIEMRGAIGELIEKWRKLGHDIGFGIGIAHGFATLGTIGFEGRFDYAAIGTVSNVASRLCDEAKPGQILISPRVLMAVEKDITVEPVGDFALKGIRRPLTAYNVLATKAAG